MPLHKDLTGADLHEPKGASGASSGTVYIANGSGSGAWAKVGLSNVDTGSIFLNRGFVSGKIDDISTASSAIVSLPVNCTVVSVTCTLGGVITAANALISVANKAGASLGTDLTIPYVGSAEGYQAVFVPSVNFNLTSPNYLKVSTDGGSTGTVPLYFTVYFVITP